MLTSAAFGQIQYTQEVVDACIPFVNGAGNYANNCYLSGLHNMAPNTCYHVRQSRINDGSVNTQYINDNAQDTWWWKTTTCATKVINVPVPGTYTLDPKCVEFHNGSGNYTANCYNSGLYNMQSGKCYEVNPARIADGTLPQTGSMNNNAADAWWWVEAECYNLVPIPNPNVLPGICNTNPSDATCQAFCTANPSDAFCVSNFCSVYPADPSCAVPSLCSNPADQACQNFCALNPDDNICGNTCLVDLNSAVCQNFCSLHAQDPRCQPPTPPTTRPNECVTDPNGSVCQAFCAANPTDGACDPTFCVNNPNDPNCFDKCINFVNGAGNYRQHCYKSGLENMQSGKCYRPNPARGNQIPVTGHMNNNAADGWWWVQTPCEKEFITPRNPGSWSLGSEKCVTFHNGSGHYVDHCYKSGLQNMAANKCYEVNPARKPSPYGDGSVPTYGHMNDDASNGWWWVETLCRDTIPARAGHPAPVYEGKVAPKAAPTLGEAEISLDNTTLSVTSTVADTKMLRVFDMNGKLLHSESFSGLAKDVDFAKFAGKGVLLVRITSGNKLVAMKKVSIR